MIIIRNKNNEERLFAISKSAQIEKLINKSIMIAEETIKMIEFYFKDNGEYRNHWSKKLAGFISEVISDEINAYSVYVAALDDKDGKKIMSLGDLNKFRLKFGSPDDFITKAKQATINDENNKYGKWVKKLSDFKLTNEDYQFIFKYLTLCLCGSMAPKELNYWMDRYKDHIKKAKLPTLKELPESYTFENDINSKNELLNVLNACFDNLASDLKSILDPQEPNQV